MADRIGINERKKLRSLRGRQQLEADARKRLGLGGGEGAGIVGNKDFSGMKQLDGADFSGLKSLDGISITIK